MAEVIDFPEPGTQKEAEMTPEELKLLIEKNEQLKLCLRIMSDLSLNEEDEDYIKDEDIDFVELWNQVSLQKKVDPGEVSGQAVAFYYNVITSGYDNFGAMFFKHFAEGPNAPYFYYAIKCFIDHIEKFSNYIESLEKENIELKNKIKELEEK